MKKIHKQPYEAPKAEVLQFDHPLDLLVGFSADGRIEDPDVDTGWGEDGNIDFGNYLPGAW